ncbi:hypothetical protein SEA_HORTUS1_78 [Microbacterium phage Hortus1]|nr:hypothetical protein SEA_HORTUS1_78 [Microbacterium phage Hortus1]AWY05648.1 hypothetical protein SEA_OLINDD_78 [Microbacterium phage OlinDD]AWY05901.1 hypothetical protein SEA_PIONEER3_78 [Microbacterium phage Pioneer3]AWY06407.1 hypothetical protein SEA_TANDEM_78 [Microbacterium phage Tandem]QCS26965.1 hypothetical protein SEA_ALLEB_118 [Microbacterium phage Alleb]
MNAPASHKKADCPYNRYECDGKMTYGPDPFQEEVWGISTPHWMCAGQRHEHAMDV